MDCEDAFSHSLKTEEDAVISWECFFWICYPFGCSAYPVQVQEVLVNKLGKRLTASDQNINEGTVGLFLPVETVKRMVSIHFFYVQ